MNKDTEYKEGYIKGKLGFIYAANPYDFNEHLDSYLSFEQGWVHGLKVYMDSLRMNNTKVEANKYEQYTAYYKGFDHGFLNVPEHNIFDVGSDEHLKYDQGFKNGKKLKASLTS
jgi:hypothetical protein